MSAHRDDRPPDMTAAARARGSRKELQQSITEKATKAVYPNPRRFVVFVRAFGRLREWSKFRDLKSASTAVQNLQKIGFDAHTKRVTP